MPVEVHGKIPMISVVQIKQSVRSVCLCVRMITFDTYTVLVFITIDVSKHLFSLLSWILSSLINSVILIFCI